MRVTLWSQGCSHMCEGCHNPSLWNFDGGKLFTGKEIHEIMQYFRIYRDYVEGLTFLGGEPFDNHYQLLELAEQFKSEFPDKTIWVWSGYTYEELMEHEGRAKLLKTCDVLVDGKFKIALKDLSLDFRGSSNQRVIDVQKSINNHSVVLYRK